MNQPNLHLTKRLGVLLLIVALSASVVVAQRATAQVPVYKVEGVVYGPDYKPLQGAVVTVLTSAGTSAGTATTDAAGKFSIGNLQSGTYNVTVAHACCEKEGIPVPVSGTDPVVQQNFRLRSTQGAQNGGTAYSLKGAVKDDAAKPLAGVAIEVWNYYEEESQEGNYYIRPPGGQQYFTTTSAADGTYSFSLRAGQANLVARKEGFSHLHANFQMGDNRILDLPMRASDEDGAIIKGTVESADGKAIEGAWVNVQPDYRCDAEVCTATSHPGEPGREEGDVYFYYEPPNPQYNGTTTGPDGTYEVRIQPGALLVSADAQNFVHEEARVTANGGETKTVDLVMEKVPADSVKVSGVVRDAKSGKPIAYAQVNLENQQWGHYNYTMTDKEGAYEFWTKPGYTLVTASAYRYYYVPCEYATEPQTSDDPSGSDEPNSSGASRPMPACDGGGNERDQEYFPRVVTLNQSADEPAALDFKLEPRPAPSATFKGYVVNASSQKAVAEATVTFFNERTNDYGSAITDAEGSYTIKVHGGYYTVRVYAAGYFDGVVNAEIGDKDEQRLDIFLTPGERKYGGGCCYAVSADGGAPYKGSSGATSARASAGPQPAGAPPSAMGAPSSEDADMASDSQDGQQSYLGTGGGLGPYKPASNDGGASPASGLLTLLLVAAFVAFALRRRQG